MVYLSVPFTSATSRVCTAAAQVTGNQDAQKVINDLNTPQIRKLISREMSHRPCPVDRISNLQALHVMFMMCEDRGWHLQGLRSAELFFVRLAARSPERVHGIKQEFHFSPEHLAMRYRHLGTGSVYIHALLGRARRHHPDN